MVYQKINMIIHLAKNCLQKFCKPYHNLCYTQKDTNKNTQKKVECNIIFKEGYYMNSVDIAEYIVFKFNNETKPITNLKLQKMLYYVQGYSYKENDRPAFDDDIVHWPYGPVVLDAYYHFCAFGGREITWLNNLDVPEIQDKKLRTIVDRVIDKCKNMKAGQLVRLTHNEAPWRESKDRGVIKNGLIRDYFEGNDPLELHT